MLKRTGYYIANRSRVNEIQKTDARQELSGRFFEGAAAGVIMLGEPPEMADFYANFGWQDAVIEVPFDYPDIDIVIRDLNQQPERLRSIRMRNILNSLRRHDAVYRLKEILKCLNIEPTVGIKDREERLKELSQKYELEATEENIQDHVTSLRVEAETKII